ncbi:TetR/AcrR family transcriptional regulator [Wukongibacter baidiensis]|uniref:TetR/AcrR family transcriptional regulator n=1 Tax=Wukongibacter baidiensis TaxID=1723361 RepID=UPI003D7F2B3B
MNKKEKIIEIAANLIHEYGYNNIGLQRILDEAQIPKGSFYYYFKNKEDLALRVIDYHVDMTRQVLNQFSKNSDGLKGFFNFYFDKFYDLEYKRGCAIGNLILELSDLNDSFRIKLLEWTTMLESEILEMLNDTNIDESTDKKAMASFLVSCFEGVLLKTKLEKTNKAIKEFNYFVFNILLNEKGGQ